VPLACPVSVPPVMLRAHALAFLRVTAPWAVVRLSWSNEVHVGLLRSVQLLEFVANRDLEPEFRRWVRSRRP
jgi:hypothetical protein